MTGTTPGQGSPSIPAPRAPAAPPPRRRVAGSAPDGRWELLADSTGVAAVTSAGTVADAHVSERDDRVIVEFWADGTDLPHELCAELVRQAFTHPAVRADRAVLVCVPRRNGAVIANYADSGESSGSFLATKALFPTVKSLVKANDLVLIQFGHNDKDTTESAFRNNLAAMVNGVRERGGIPVLVTPPVRRLFSGNTLTSTALHVNNKGVDLPAVIRALGKSANVPVVDLTAKSKTLVQGLGPAGSQKIYLTKASDGVTDNTHFSQYGATQMANLVVQGIRELNLPLTGYLR